ncbi:hypothetical protein H206_01501 [Candidatus Electrothrix aarhusensis]|uniref:Uncharacterized protein n=1 Tax=Candidatus Electrothrix aarhusensis TaxID=1859131 RepID=A0A3S4T7D8_9BACT|nr:hypothetical protein H206_01501 [Candidatus Electrothrix aarhusensis]
MKKQILSLAIILILSTNIGLAGTLSTFYGTATITAPADLPPVDLALQLDLNGTAVLHDTSYIILEKTMLFPVIPPLVDAQEVGPRLEGTVGPDTFQLRTTPFSDQAGGKTVNRQIFFNNAVVGNQGNSITGEYNETVTGLLPAPFSITGEFILMRPVSSLSDSVTDNDNSGCLDLDESGPEAWIRI